MNKLKSLVAPISANMEITDRCNLKCFFCFCGTDAYQKSLSTMSGTEKLANAKRILDILAKNNVFEIRLFGGEFSLLSGWREIVEHALKLGFFVSFVSNGTIFNDNDIEFLINKKVETCSISLHGFGDLHDQIVQVSGSFKKASRNIRMLSDGGIKVAVPFTPTKVNISHLEDFARSIIKDFGATSVGVNRLFCGDRYENLNFHDYEQLFIAIEKLQNEGLSVFFIDSFPRCKVSPKYWKYMSHCSHGIGFCQIDYMGNIKNCSSLSVNIGNVFRESLKDIWQTKLSEFRELKHLPLSCRLCPIFCGGGCIASRTIEHNFVADEFIKLPLEETLIESLTITARNYARKWLYMKREYSDLGKGVSRKESDRPKITRKYRIRKEGENSYLCMISGKGIVSLNEKSVSILKLLDENRTISEIVGEVALAYELKITQEDIEEVLRVFVD